MQFYFVALLFGASALAVPTGGGGGGGGGGSSYQACPSTLFSNPQCCATDVLGVVGLNCGNPSATPSSKSNFVKDCATRGQQALCCVLPAAGQAVLCQPPV